jgi:hypothetical protein
MPTRKPDMVTEHRVTIGRWERENLKVLNQAKIVKDVGIGVGVTAFGIGSTYVAYKIGKGILDWGEDIVDKAKEEFSKLNPTPIFTGDRPLPDVPEDATPRNDGWIFGGPPTILQIAIENTLGIF